MRPDAFPDTAVPAFLCLLGVPTALMVGCCTFGTKVAAPGRRHGTGLVTVVTLIWLRADREVRALEDPSDATEEGEDNGDGDDERDTDELGARGEALSKRKTCTSPVDGTGSTRYRRASAWVLSRETKASVLPLVVIELRGRAGGASVPVVVVVSAERRVEPCWAVM